MQENEVDIFFINLPDARYYTAVAMATAGIPALEQGTEPKLIASSVKSHVEQ